MVPILVILFFVAAIAVDALIVERLARQKAKQLFQDHYMSGLIPEPEAEQDLLFHEGHSWLRMDKALFAVGMDEFTRRLLGDVDAIETPVPGTEVTKGRTAWTVRVGERRLEMKAPISGRVYAVNDALVRDPNLLSRGVYEQGWIMKIVPDHALRELPDLYTPARFMKWLELQKSRLVAAVTPEIGMSMADGAAIDDGAIRSVDEATWGRIREIVFGLSARKDEE
jgi:glycine cleavage system H protein